MQHFFLSFLLITCIASCDSKVQNFKLAEKAGDASCSNYLILDGKKEITVPNHINEALDCPAIVDLKDHILTVLIDQTVILYDLKTSKESKLFTMHPDMDGISNPVWSEDGSNIMFVIINQQKKLGYTEIARIISLELSDQMTVLSKKKYDRPVHFTCGSLCKSKPYFDFKYELKGISYKRNENISERPGAFELIAWDDPQHLN